MNVQGMIWLLSGEVDEERGLRHYMVKQLLKLLKFIPGVKCRCFLMRMINTVGWSLMGCEKFVLSRKFNIKIQSLFQRYAATWHQTPSWQGLCGSLDVLIVPFQMMQVGDDPDSALQQQHLLLLHVSSCPCSESSLYAAVEINHRLTTPHRGNPTISP